MLHGFGESLRGESIQDVVFRQPGAPGLQDPITDFFHVGGVVRIGIDHDLYPVLFCHPQVDITQVKPVGIRVQLHGHFVFRRSPLDRVEIKLVSVAPQQKATRGMADHGHIRILDGL